MVRSDSNRCAPAGNDTLCAPNAVNRYSRLAVQWAATGASMPAPATQPFLHAFDCSIVPGMAVPPMGVPKSWLRESWS
jgi:hypothetical protein